MRTPVTSQRSSLTKDGFGFKRVCFGLSSAPSAFQRLMASILAGLDIDGVGPVLSG